MDTNGDGTLEALDATWAHLKLWIDGSSAGAASGGSLATIDSLGIASIGLASLQVNLTDGSQLSSDGTFAWQTAGAGDIMAAGSALDVAALANDIHKPTANYA